MSTTAQYVRVSQEEFDEILCGKCQSLISERMQRNGEARRSDGKLDEMMALCVRYAQHNISQAGGRWESVKPIAKRLKVSERKLKAEAKRRGLHIWLDLDKLWQEMHVFLTGTWPSTRSHSHDLPIVEEKNNRDDNPNMRGQVVNEIEDAHNAIQTLAIELRGSLARDLSISRFVIEVSNTSSAVSSLSKTITHLENNHASALHPFEEHLATSAKIAKAAQRSMSRMVEGMRCEQEAEVRQCSESLAKLAAASFKMQDLLWKKVCGNPSCGSQSGDPHKLLSMSVIGGESISERPGGSYLTANQVRAIADAFAELSYSELLSTNGDPGIDDFHDCFDKFKEFYVEAAWNDEAVICLMS